MNFECKEKQVGCSHQHHGHSSQLATDAIAGHAHGQRKNGTAKQSHNHEARHLVFVLRATLQCLRQRDGKHVRVAQPNECHAKVKRCFAAKPCKADEAAHYANYAEDEETAVRHAREEKGTQQTPDGAAYKVERSDPAGMGQRQSFVLLKYARSGGVDAHINAHMTQNADEAAAHHGPAHERKGAS